MALPPRGQRGMATAAHGHDDLNHFKDFHPYHILPGSPWPALSGLGATAGCLSALLGKLVVPGMFCPLPISGCSFENCEPCQEGLVWGVVQTPLC